MVINLNQPEIEEIRHLYWDEKFNIKETAKKLGTTHSAVHRRMIKYGIPRRSQKDWAVKGFQFSDESKKKMSLIAKERFENPENCPMYGRHHSKESKEKMSLNKRGERHPMYGKHHSPQTTLKMSKSKMGEKNPNWQNGISFEPYSFEFNDFLKKEIKERDNHRCQFPNCEAILNLAVHHIDYDKKNNVPLNLITLCNKHNAKVNFNREYWTDYFQGIVN